MGLYDRDYYRDEQPGIRLSTNWSAVATLIGINVLVFIAELFTTGPRASWIEHHLALQPDLLEHPWNFWQLLTYGFVHDSSSPWHIVFNMIGLWFFGSEVETVYGKLEFYKVYISTIILAGLANLIISSTSQIQGPLIGASGGVMGVAVIFACHFPRRLIYIYGIIPVPAMVCVIAFVALDFVGTLSTQDPMKGPSVAHWAHLAGAAFGFLYYRTGWNLFRLWPRGWSAKRIRMPMRGPKLRVHRESDDEIDEAPPDDYLTTGRLQKRVDELLEKISRSGEGSLTDEERQFLADASRRYQQQRRR
jgi:membrane associated rhomboid family serine protease